MPTRTVKVTIDTEGNIDIKPTFLNIPNGPDTITLRWEGVDLATFPESEFFAWKAGTGQPTVHRRHAQLLESDTYVNNAHDRRLWRYWINVNGTKVDPEVNNQPPGGGMPAGQVGQPGGGQQSGGQQGGGQQGGGQSGGGQQGGGGSQPGNP
jgi:hypothetical protein